MKSCPEPTDRYPPREPKDGEPLICAISGCKECSDEIYRKAKRTGCCVREGPPEGSLLVGMENPTYILQGFPEDKP